MPPFFDILWDDEAGGNVEHLAEHGVSIDEAEWVLQRFFHDREPSWSNPDRWVVVGETRAGRVLVVVFEYVEAYDLVVPVTAYEPEKLDR